MKQLLPAALLWLSASTVLAAPNAQALATSKNCLACHAVDRKLVGRPTRMWRPATPARRMP
jgi:cytochrome c